MSTATAPRSTTPWTPPFSVYRFTVDQYDRMIEQGILTADDRVELLEGWIVPKMPHNPPHDATIVRVTRRLRFLPEEWLLRVQCAITLRKSKPEPDFAIVHGPEENYVQEHPRPSDIALLIEVADSSLLSDRQYKGQLYAEARIAEYWIINLVSATIQVFSSPRGGKSPGYRQQRDYGKDEVIPLVLGGQELARIPVRELLI